MTAQYHNTFLRQQPYSDGAECKQAKQGVMLHLTKLVSVFWNCIEV